MASTLEDLDELVLRCRDLKARSYIAEAVSSYRVGAFRSAIVAAWIAVCFDIMEKLRELALAGDKQAEQYAQDVDAIRRTGDLTRALKFERELLEIALNDFELISPLEHVDLERLQADRNRCAHPSLTADDQAYSPAAELARLHIHSAITHVLQHPPVQGKFALDRLIGEINSEYFPTAKDKARVALDSGPLRRPRDSLVRNLTLVLAKGILDPELDYKKMLRYGAALAAAREMHPAQTSAALKERLTSLIRAVPDDQLKSVIGFLKHVEDCWTYLEPDVVQRIQNFVAELPRTEFEEVDFLLEFAPLRASALKRVNAATADDFVATLFFIMPTEVRDRLISLYLKASTFERANKVGKELSSAIVDCDWSQVKTLIQGAAANDQVTGSFQLAAVIAAIRKHFASKHPELDELLEAHGLGDYVPAPEEPDDEPPF